LVGQAGTDEDIDADEVSPGGGGDRHGAHTVVAKQVDTEGAGEKFTSLTGKGGEAGDGGRTGGVGGERRVAKIFHDDGVGAALFQSEKIAAHGLADGQKFSAVAGGTGEGRQVDHADQAAAREDSGDGVSGHFQGNKNTGGSEF